MEISDALWQKLRRQRLAGTPSPPGAEFRAKVFGYRDCRVAIGDQQIDLPCGGTPRLQNAPGVRGRVIYQSPGNFVRKKV